jgi:sec-independent protein translocase protein TatA
MLVGQDLLILLAIAFLIFGTNKLPEIGPGMGKAIRGFKDAVNGNEKETLDAPPVG